MLRAQRSEADEVTKKTGMLAFTLALTLFLYLERTKVAIRSMRYFCQIQFICNIRDVQECSKKSSKIIIFLDTMIYYPLDAKSKVSFPQIEAGPIERIEKVQVTRELKNVYIIKGYGCFAWYFEILPFSNNPGHQSDMPRYCVKFFQ